MSLRALIADDGPKLAEYLAGRLTELWPELEIRGIAVNGNEALTKINTEKPDLAFLDIKMPGISGLEVARRMTHPSLIVFVTAYNKRVSLGELIMQLDPEKFWRIHRSTIVNASKVVSVSQTGRETHVLTVKDHREPLTVSRAFIHQFKQM